MKLALMEEYESNESESTEDNTSLYWSKAVTVGKKVLAAVVVVSSTPLLVPLLVLALFASVPYFFFLANYACTQKLMSSLLPSNEETSGTENDDSGFGYSKLGHGQDLNSEFDEQILSQIEEDAEMAKESTSLIERLRDEGRTDERTSEDDDDKVQDQDASKTPDAGKLEGRTTETLKEKDEEPSSNEPVDQEVSAQRGTGEDKRKNTTKKKKKTGRAGV